MVYTITAANFEELTGRGKPVLMEFWAPWCTYCLRITAAFSPGSTSA